MKLHNVYLILRLPFVLPSSIEDAHVHGILWIARMVSMVTSENNTNLGTDAK